MDESQESDGWMGLQLRSYQLEMLEENMQRNIIVAVYLRRTAFDLIKNPDNEKDGHRFGEDHDSSGTHQGRARNLSDTQGERGYKSET